VTVINGKNVFCQNNQTTSPIHTYLKVYKNRENNMILLKYLYHVFIYYFYHEYKLDWIERHANYIN
jgi:hypothetical protein